jgi:hypothetical protein
MLQMSGCFIRRILMEFKRLLPQEGMIITVHKSKDSTEKILLNLVDFLDLDPIEKIKIQETIRSDPTYALTNSFHTPIPKGELRTIYSCWITNNLDRQAIGFLSLKEYLNNPDGYGEGDFLQEKWIAQPFQRTIYSKFISLISLHLMFLSGLAKRIYAYMPAFKEDLWQSISDEKSVCVGIPYLKDVSKPFIKVVKKVIGENTYFLMEFDGEMYRSMGDQVFESKADHKIWSSTIANVALKLKDNV